MATAQYFKEAANSLWGLYKELTKLDFDALHVRRLLDNGFELLHNAAVFNQRQDLTTADKQKLQAAVALIKTLVQLLRDQIEVAEAREAFANEPEIFYCELQRKSAAAAILFQNEPETFESVQGAGVAVPEDIIAVTADEAPAVNEGSQEDVLSLSDINSAFENRIKTVMVTNLKHLDL